MDDELPDGLVGALLGRHGWLILIVGMVCLTAYGIATLVWG